MAKRILAVGSITPADKQGTRISFTQSEENKEVIALLNVITPKIPS